MFKIKDLMIKVIPELEDAEKQNGGCYCTNGCTQACSQACSNGVTCRVCTDWTGTLSYLCAMGQAAKFCICSDQCSACTPNYFTCGECTAACSSPCTHGGCSQPATCGAFHTDYPIYGVAAARPQRSLENLAALKSQLKQQLGKIEEEEKRVEASLAPASLAEAELLEKKLEEALEEVRGLKERLKK